MQSSVLLVSSNTIYIFLVFVVVSVIVLYNELISRIVKVKKCAGIGDEESKVYKKAPGPRAYPIIGNLASLDGYEVPYQAFTDLAERYGSIVSLQLGNVPALVVNGIENIREVLINKTSHFDSRPNFRRYHQLFSGNKENSLAFCDWSETQKLRRDMLVAHTFPRSFSNRFEQLNTTITFEIKEMLSLFDNKLNDDVPIKPILLKSCANIFTQYFCSRRFKSSDSQFEKLISNFDKVFFEVNQGYAADFLPFLMPFHKKNLKQMENWSHEIREIILDRIIEDRLEKPLAGKDYVDALIDHVHNDENPAMDWNTALFALEDIIGGHSAVGNFLMKVVGYLVQHPEVQQNIQNEVDGVLQDKDENVIDLKDRNSMPYTEAVILESLRLIASPIVPHVSNQASTVGGYDVEPNTLIFLNNYDLSMSQKLWDEPKLFKPERFIKSGHLVKPDFFLPFGAGRRSCMGYKLVQFISFSILTNIFKNYNLTPIEGENYKIAAGSLAMPEKSFKIGIRKRL